MVSFSLSVFPGGYSAYGSYGGQGSGYGASTDSYNTQAGAGSYQGQGY